MSTTAHRALAAIRARLEADDSGITVPLRWHGDRGSPMPDEPQPFAFMVFNNEGSGGGPIEIGGGRGSNRFRNNGTVEAYVFVPEEHGLSAAMEAAETIAARLRSFRDADVSCWSADVIPVGAGSQIAPPGLKSEVSLFQCAVAEIELSFDQIG